MPKGWISFEGLGRRHLLRNRPDTNSRHLPELSVHSLKLQVCVEACCCERRMCLAADLASLDLEMRQPGRAVVHHLSFLHTLKMYLNMEATRESDLQKDSITRGSPSIPMHAISRFLAKPQAPLSLTAVLPCISSQFVQATIHAATQRGELVVIHLQS